ncbi:MAG: DUF5908 family protein [Bacteroidota bacterium]
MAIEIKELKVKFNVTGKQEQSTSNEAIRMNEAAYKRLVKDCTENVLRKLKRETER